MLNSDGPIKLILIGLFIGLATSAFAQPPPSQCLQLQDRVNAAREIVGNLERDSTVSRHPAPGLAQAKQNLAGAERALAQCIVAAAATAPPIAVVEGRVYRENSSAEVYLISAGKKIWVPTADALFAMGFNWSSVTVVPNGTLNAHPRINIPSLSLTPGSLIFPPNRMTHFPLAVVPGAVRVVWQGMEIQLVELYGWLRKVADKCELADAGGDFHYALELDTDWALAHGIDLNRLLRVGNIWSEGIRLPGFSPRRSVSLPLITVELNSWEWRGVTAGRTKPADWNFVGNCDVDSHWPFDQKHPVAGKDQKLDSMDLDIANRGPYVRIAGSLVTDEPHEVQHHLDTFDSRVWGITHSEKAEWEGSVPDWHPGMDSRSPDHYARWTEIHPPDLIEVQSQQKEPRVTVRAVGLAARVGVLPFGWSNSCEEAKFDIFPEASRPPSSSIRYEELRGPETHWPWGQDANNGSWITVFDDHVHVKARVCGGERGGSPGRFKAIYRVWWETVASGSTTRTGSFITSDYDEIHYVIDPNVVANNEVEFRLCLGAGLTWEKRMNMPDGQGTSWDLIVKNSTRCATDSLWAGQVSNGQSLTFYKLKAFWQGMTKVHEVPTNTFAPLPGGSRVTFTWIND